MDHDLGSIRLACRTEGKREAMDLNADGVVEGLCGTPSIHWVDGLAGNTHPRYL